MRQRSRSNGASTEALLLPRSGGRCRQAEGGALRPHICVPPAGRSPGFTLLEVLIALLVLSLSLVALIRLVTLHAQAGAQLRDSTLAQWVAANVIAETRLRSPYPATGRSNGEVTMGEQRWHWELVVAGTDEPTIRRLDVRVTHAEAERDAEGVVAALTGFAAQP
nr:type II secretion system minor pseudopilin GspI [Chiayiivirga flava]